MVCKMHCILAGDITSEPYTMLSKRRQQYTGYPFKCTYVNHCANHGYDRFTQIQHMYKRYTLKNCVLTKYALYIFFPSYTKTTILYTVVYSYFNNIVSGKEKHIHGLSLFLMVKGYKEIPQIPHDRVKGVGCCVSERITCQAKYTIN
jgi:hypothetical protein